MALLGTLAAVRSQIAQAGHFAAGFQYTEAAARPGSAEYELLFRLAPGATERVDLAGGAFALLQCYLTKPRREARWETHVQYIDIQVIYLGEEYMELANRARLTVAEDLTPARDVVFYHPFPHGSVLRCGPGDAAIYFPTDAHLGAVAVDAPMLVRKIVIKVPSLLPSTTQ